MLSFDPKFSDEIELLVRQLKDSPHAEKAKKSLEKAWTVRTQGDVLEIFRELRDELSASKEDWDRHVSSKLNNLMEQEEIRIQKAFSKTFAKKREPTEIEGPAPKRRRTTEGAEVKETLAEDSVSPMAIDTEQSTTEGMARKRPRSAKQKGSVEGQPPPAKRQKTTPQTGSTDVPKTGLTDLPPYLVREIAQHLSLKDETALLFTSKAQILREGLFMNVLSNPECQQLYKLIFGMELPSATALEEQRREAITSGEPKKLAELEGKLRSILRVFIGIQKEWEALPEEVRTCFGNIDTSAIHSSPERFKDFLQAIRAYNLNLVGRKLGYLDAIDFSTKKTFLDGAETTAQRLKAASDGITRCDLSWASLTHLPLEITMLPNLTSLDLTPNQLTSVLPEIGNLTKLTTLNLSQNQLTFVPSEIGNLTQLTFLDLGQNQLRSAPPEIGNLSELTDLRLHQNQFESLPPEIGKLTKLTSLALSQNKLTSLPPEIKNLTQLTDLWLTENQLSSTGLLEIREIFSGSRTHLHL